MTAKLKHRARNLWQGLLTLTGDDAYQRYLRHWRQEHADSGERPMSRREFYLAEQQRKWNKPNRCC
ncbi:MAG: YbdD/YjiX family protein [Gammaproteobacteria bacterium]|nr:YbdD/YjiX family protein [Gammaproteobacteria bacterium]